MTSRVCIRLGRLGGLQATPRGPNQDPRAPAQRGRPPQAAGCARPRTRHSHSSGSQPRPSYKAMASWIVGVDPSASSYVFGPTRFVAVGRAFLTTLPCDGPETHPVEDNGWPSRVGEPGGASAEGPTCLPYLSGYRTGYVVVCNRSRLRCTRSMYR